MAFLEDIHQLLQFIEKLIKTVTINLLDSCQEEIVNYRKTIKIANDNILSQIVESSYQVMDFDEACTILSQNSDKLTQPLNKNKHLSKEHELFLVQHCRCPVFVIKWPRDNKPFYVKATQDESYVRSLICLIICWIRLLRLVLVSGRCCRFAVPRRRRIVWW